MNALVLSRNAEKDLESIARYTRQEWGHSQADIYLDKMRERLALLRQHPEQGTPRDDVRAGYRSVLAGSHVVIYAITAERIRIIRILHEHMDVHRAIPGSEESSA